jgi:hypothetical protein
LAPEFDVRVEDPFLNSALDDDETVIPLAENCFVEDNGLALFESFVKKRTQPAPEPLAEAAFFDPAPPPIRSRRVRLENPFSALERRVSTLSMEVPTDRASILGLPSPAELARSGAFTRASPRAPLSGSSSTPEIPHTHPQSRSLSDGVAPAFEPFRHTQTISIDQVDPFADVVGSLTDLFEGSQGTVAVPTEEVAPAQETVPILDRGPIPPNSALVDSEPDPAPVSDSAGGFLSSGGSD